MDILFDGNRRRLAHRPPDSYVRRFGGYLQPNLECRDAVLFDRHSPSDEFLGVGTDEGRFYFGRVPQFLNGADGRADENVGEPALVEPDGRRHAIFDFAFLPDRKVLLASLGGFVYLLDANTRQLTTVVQTAANTYFGASSEDPNLFVLGTRDSLVFRCYDVREPQQTRLVSTYDETKMATPNRKILTPTRKKATPTTPTRKKATPMTPPVQEVKLTTIRHIRDRFFATTTTSHEKGIRVWDMRYAKGHTPVHTWEIPPCGRSNFGCYGMQLDRGGVKLLAGCTDGKLREYEVHSGSTLPSRVFGGGSVGSFQHNVVYSPFSSLFVGPMKQGIGIWDSFQSPETPQSPAPSSQSTTPSRRTQRFTPPRFGFKSCDEQTLSNCDWSPSGRYLAITTQQAFMICDGESEWARRAANAELSDFTNVDEFGVPLDFAFPMSSNRPRLPSPPDSRVGVINEEDLAAYRTNKRARIDAELSASAAAAAARSRPPSAPSAPRAGSSRQVAVVTIDDDDFDTNGVLRRTQSRMDDFLKGATNKSKLRTDFKTASGHRIVRHSEEPSGRDAPFAPPRNEDGSENRPAAARVNDVLRAVSTNRRDEHDRFSRVPRKKTTYEPLRLPRNVGANRAYRDPMRSAAEEAPAAAPKAEESEEAPLDETDLLINNDPVLKAMDKNIIDMIKSEIIVLDLSLSWSDVVGLEGAKSALREIIVLPSIRPDLFRHLRKPSKAVLLFGPPGTGKTMIGRCVANQCKATFFNISASALTSKWVGEGEKLVRALFRIARLKEPSVIFIDEVDSLLSTRRESEHESSRRIKTEFLVQMDGIASNSGERLFVLAATNKPSELDEAARRRFEKRLYIALPTADARKSMLDTNLGGLIHDLTPEALELLADRTDGYSGADMRQLCAEAAMGPIREIEDMSTMDIETVKEEDIRPISMRDFDDALQSVRPTVLQSELDAYRAYDEAFGYRKTPPAVAQEPLAAARKEAAQMS